MSGSPGTAPATLLGFDYGSKHIGVAVGQTLTATASPLETVNVRNSRPDWNAIGRLFETWRPDAMVVGLPLMMDGTEQDVTHDVHRFRGQLEGRFGIPVYTADERLSTKEARSRLAERGVPIVDDHPVAAQIILETWLSQGGAE